ncbi:MAG: histidinol-phosphate transaminase [Clostridia bacterium]|nr:histidinol-phosphate transaminase [Clostridia bacterium]
MTEYLSSLAKGLEPYVPGEQPGDGDYIKLNTNESPYPPSPKVQETIRKMADGSLRLYPDPSSGVLIKAASAYHGVPEEMIFAGNGSDEVLAFAFAAFYAGKKVVFPKVTYSFYPVYCGLFNAGYSQLPMVEKLGMDLDGMAGCGCGVVFPNPNAPTGELAGLEWVERIAASNPGNVVLVDEAYIDFGGESSARLTGKYENLLVVQTMSKSRALAGMRIGLAFGSEKLIDGLKRVRDSFNSYPLNRLSQYAGAAALEDDAYYKDMCGKIIRTREKSFGELERLGFEFIRSSSNFILASHPEVPAAKIYQVLKGNNILVRYFAKEPLQNHIRITVGTDGQMKILFDRLEKIIGGC